MGFIGVLVFALLLAGCSNQQTQQPQQAAQSAAETIKIGVMLPLSGDNAIYGDSVKRGIELAKNDLGLTNVQLIYEDTKCSGKDAVTGITKLITVDNVRAVIGELCSAGTLPAAPLANQYEVPLVSPTASAPKIKFAGDYIFRVMPSDEYQGVYGAELLKNKGFKKLAILYSNGEYGAGLKDALVENFNKLGGSVVATEAFQSKDSDVRTQLTKIKDKSPDVLYVISDSLDSSTAALKQIKELGISAAVFGSEALYVPELITNTQGAAEGMSVTSVKAGNDQYRARYKAFYGADASVFSERGYDAMKTVALAMQKGAKTGKEIKDALYTVEFEGTTGPIKFDSFGEIAGSYDLYKVVDGKFELENN